MVDKTSQMFVTGPDVIKTVTGEDVGMEELGGALTHNTVSGVAHYLAADEDDALDYARTLIGFLPGQQPGRAPGLRGEVELEITDEDRKLNTVIPDCPNQPYDVKTVIEHIVDDGDFLEVQPLFAPNIVIGFGRVEGRSVGHHRQPAERDGRHAQHRGRREGGRGSCGSATRSRIPILTLVDVPGYLPGTDQEWTGVIRRGAKLLFAYAEATVPLVTVITRKAYGGAYIVMGSKQLGADINYAWPTAEIAVMGGQGAVNILYRGEIKAAETNGEDVAAVRTKLANEYTYNVASPFLAAERGELDGVIEPAATRVAVTKALRALRTKRASLPAEEAREHPAVSASAAGLGRAGQLTVLAGNPTSVELAAVTAVILGVVQERAFDRVTRGCSRPKRLATEPAPARGVHRSRARRLAQYFCITPPNWGRGRSFGCAIAAETAISSEDGVAGKYSRWNPGRCQRFSPNVPRSTHCLRGKTPEFRHPFGGQLPFLSPRCPPKRRLSHPGADLHYE